MERRRPFEPDSNGLCYADEQHFDETMTRVARDHLAARAGLAESRFIPLFLLVCVLISLAAWRVAGNGAGFLAFAFSGVCIVMYAQRETRYARRVERQKLCFGCGYQLEHLEPEDLETGRCPECGTPFRNAYYRRPPPMYESPRGSPSPPEADPAPPAIE